MRASARSSPQARTCASPMVEGSTLRTGLSVQSLGVADHADDQATRAGDRRLLVRGPTGQGRGFAFGLDAARQPVSRPGLWVGPVRVSQAGDGAARPSLAVDLCRGHLTDGRDGHGEPVPGLGGAAARCRA